MHEILVTKAFVQIDVVIFYKVGDALLLVHGSPPEFIKFTGNGLGHQCQGG
jgi:hypothetical protein